VKHWFVAITFIVGMSAAQSVQAVPVPMADVPAMTANSDVIVVGRASLTRNDLAPFLVTVDRVIKGATTGPRLIVAPSPGYPAVQEGQYGIFFLRRQRGSAPYVVTDPFHPALVASPLRAPNRQMPTDVLGALTGELIAVLTTRAAVLTDPVNGVQGLVTGDPADQAQYVYFGAATALQTFPYAVVGPALSALARSNQVPANLWAMHCLFSMVDFDDESAKAGYLASAAPILIDPEPNLAVGVTMLANAVESHLKTPQAVPTLAALLGSANVAVRRAAAAVLSEIATPGVVGPLAKVALNDDDERVRFLAVRGLTAATGAGESTTTAAFRQQPDEFLRFWRNWARSNVQVP
jgi:HEAT repeats